MPSTTTFRRGDVVLVEFVFADESGTKLRPALVLSTAAYHRSRSEVIIAAITSNVTRHLYGDHEIADWQHAGLLFPSSVTGVVRIVKRPMIRRRIGTLHEFDQRAVDLALRRSMGL